MRLEGVSENGLWLVYNMPMYLDRWTALMCDKSKRYARVFNGNHPGVIIFMSLGIITYMYVLVITEAKLNAKKTEGK